MKPNQPNQILINLQAHLSHLLSSFLYGNNLAMLMMMVAINIEILKYIKYRIAI